MKLLTAILSSLVLAAPAMADHASENAYRISQVAWSAATDAENLADAAWGEAGGWRSGLSTGEASGPQSHVSSEVEPFDHRDEKLRSLGSVAEDVHMALSDLYRAARYRNGPADHQGDRIRREFRRSRGEFERLQRAWRHANEYSLPWNVRNNYYEVKRSFNRLSYLVYGNRR